MTQMRLAKGDVFVLGDTKYEFTRRYPDGRIEVEQWESGERKSMTDLELAEMVAHGEAVIRPGAMKSRENIVVQRRDFGSLEEPIKQKAHRIYRYLMGLQKRGITIYSRNVVRDALKQIAKEIGDEKPPAYSTVCKWRKIAGPDLDVRNLIDQRHFREGGARLSARVQEIIDRKVSERYMTMLRRTIKDSWDQICKEIEKMNKLYDAEEKLCKPSYWAVREAIKRIDQYAIVKSRYGQAAANARFDAVNKGPVATRPLEAAELDHTVMDVMVIDDQNFLPLGRPTVVFLIDRMTRMPLGFHISFDSPSVQTVAECLKNAILPKSYVAEAYPDIRNEWPCYGVPTTIILDRGMENIGKDMEDMAATLGFNVELCPSKKPWFKGRIERFLGTMNRQLSHKIPGSTFSNIFERGDYNSVENAIVTFGELRHLIHKWLIDDYAQSPHRGLGGVPSKAWASEILEHPIRPLPDRVDIDAYLGRTEVRVLSRKGIEFENLQYLDSGVVEWLRDGKFCDVAEKTKTGVKVKIKYDPTDLSKIWVLDHRNGLLIEVPCLDQEYTKNLSLWQHRVIKNYLRREMEQNVDLPGLQSARAEIQEIIDGIMKQRKGKRRTSTAAKISRYEGVGRNAPAGSTFPSSTPSSATTLPHASASGSTRRTKKKVRPPKRQSVATLPSYSNDDEDIYADEL